MGSASTAPVSELETAAAQPHALAKGALGLPQILFCIVTGSAPLVGFVTQGIVIWLMIENRTALAGDVGYIQAIPYIVLAIFAAGVALAYVYRARARERYSAIGRFVHEEA